MRFVTVPIRVLYLFYHVYLHTSEPNVIPSFGASLFYLSNFGLQATGLSSQRHRRTAWGRAFLNTSPFSSVFEPGRQAPCLQQ